MNQVLACNESLQRLDERISHKRKRIVDILDRERLDEDLHDYKAVRTTTPRTEIIRVDSFTSLQMTTEIESRKCALDKFDISSNSTCNLSCLPQELALKVISYIGPRSSTLIQLSQVDKRFHCLMSRVGAAMLLRAKSNFRILLPKLNSIESDLCLFMRHSQSHYEIQRKCKVLRDILKKDFIVGCNFGPIIVRSLRSDGSKAENVTSTPVEDASRTAVSIEEINFALDIALELMGQDVLSYFLDNCNLTVNDVDRNLLDCERQNIIQHCSENLEFQVLSLAGQCGAKVYKYMKMQQAIRGCWDMNYGSIKSTADHADIRRVDRARLLMQLVICRDIELAQKDAQLGHRRKRLAVGRSGIIIEPGLIQSLLLNT